MIAQFLRNAPSVVSDPAQLDRLRIEAKRMHEKYASVFDAAIDGLCLLTHDGVILESNARWQTLLAADGDELVGRHVQNFMTLDTAPLPDSPYLESTPDAQERVLAVRRRDGSLRYIEFWSNMVEFEGESVILSIGRDVSAFVRATQELNTSEARYRALVDRMPDMLWTLREDGVLSFATGNAENILGYTSSELSFREKPLWPERVHPDDRDLLRTSIERLIDSNTLFDIEFRWQKKDGTWIWVRSRAVAAYKLDDVRLFDGTLADITERRELEHNARQAQKMDALSRLTGGIAHDFNNVLAAIIANAHFLLKGLPEHDTLREDAQEIQRAAERASSLTRQLLAFSRRQILSPTIVDLNTTVVGLEKMLRRLISEDIALQVIPSQRSATVRADVGQIEQVVMNLVVNARDAMPEGGELNIEVSSVFFERDEDKAHPAMPLGAYHVIKVTDTGTGMDAETLSHIYEPFFTTKGPGRGTGLGLSTCYGIVKQSGGFIFADSKLGEGSSFRVYLPHVDGQPELPRARAHGVASTDQSKVVLLLEDDDWVRSALARILRGEGYRVIEARSQDEVRRIATDRKENIDIVVSDVVMPNGSGPESVDILRASFPKVRALFMSGYTDHAIFENRELRASINFLQKPFAPADLCRKVREILNLPAT